MSSDYQVATTQEGRIIVLLHPDCEIGRDEVLALLRELGVDASTVTFVEPDRIADCGDLEGAPVIIPIDNGSCDIPELENAARYCGDAGGRVAVLFGSGYSYEGLHPIADKYGTQCGWSIDQLRDCVFGDVDAPRDATGRPADRSEAREVKCRR